MLQVLCCHVLEEVTRVIIISKTLLLALTPKSLRMLCCYYY